MKYQKKTILIAALLSTPNLATCVLNGMDALEISGSFSDVIATVLFPLIVIASTVYYFPLAQILGFGEGKLFWGEDGLVFPTTFPVCLSVTIIYGFLFYFIVFWLRKRKQSKGLSQ